MKHLSTLLMVWGLCISFAFGRTDVPSYTPGTTGGDSHESFQFGMPGTAIEYNDYSRISSSNVSYTASIINNLVWGSGEAIDDVSYMFMAPLDAAAIAIEPNGQSCFGTAETITVLLRNDGTQIIDFSTNNAVVTVDITGASTQNFTTTVTSGTVGIMNTFPVVVTVNADLSTQGFHNFLATVTMVGDTVSTNDTALGFVESLSVFPTPYLEDFETFVTTPLPGVLMNGWTFGNTTGFRWQVDDFGTTSTGTGPADDHTDVGSIYMYTEATTGLVNDSTSIFSPCIDLSGLNTPRLAFWYHMHGAAMGTLKVYANVSGTSTLVWSLSGPQQDSDTDEWLEAIADLSAFGGQIIQLEFRGIRGTSFTSDMAIDDIEIYEPAPLDAAAFDVSPEGASCYSTTETVTVLVRNEGNQILDFSVNNAVVTVDITGASTQNFTTTVTSGTVGILNTFPVDVTVNADLSAQGFHNFLATVAIVGDTISSNDSTLGFVETLPVFPTPYLEDFETFLTTPLPGVLMNGWTFGNTAGYRWQVDDFGTTSTGTGPADDHTALGSIYLYTEATTGITDDSTSIFSPCIDLAGLTAPRLAFWYHMHGDQMGTLKVYANVSGTSTLIWSLSGEQQGSDTDDWLEAIADLTAFAGQTIQLEFAGIRGTSFTSDMAIDDVEIYDPAPLDAAAFEIEPEGANCYSAAETVTVLIRNEGNQLLDFSVNNAVVTLDITGASTQNFTTTITSGTVGVLNTFPVDITVNADLSAQGFHNFLATVAIVGDTISSNDSTLGFVESLPVVTAPYIEDFETFIVGVPGVLANGWRRSITSAAAQGWIVDNFGTPTGNTGPADDHTATGSNYMFIESSSFPGINTDFSLFSPCVDLTSATAPRLKFWYHMFGNNMGTLEVHAVAPGLDSLIWTLSGPQQSASADPWLEVIADLSPFVGQTIQIEFRGNYAFTGTSDMAIDDVEIYDPAPLDAAAIEIEPNGASCYSAAETVTVLIRNEGNQLLDFSVNNAVITLDITGASTQNFTTTVTSGTVGVLNTFPVDVTVNADLSAQGFHNFLATVAIVGDTINSNDSTLGFVETLPVVTAPYVEDFETFTVGVPGILANGWRRSATTAASQGWIVDNFGTPTGNTGPADDHTATGSNYMFIESSSFAGLNTDFSLFSPCIDLTGLIAPQLKFWYHMFGANMGTLEVHALAPGVDSLLWSATGPQQSSSADPWLEVIANLSPFIGQTIQIEFRGSYAFTTTSDMAIDDVEILDPAPLDAALSGIISPLSECGLGSNLDVVVEVTNFGSSTLSSVDVNVSINNGPVTTLTSTVTLPPFGTTLVSFPGNDFSTPGDYDILSWTSLTGDTLPLNDTAFTTVTSIPIITTYPYFEDFESGNGGWLAEQGANGTWAFGTPAKTVIQGASSGANAWVTGDLGTTVYNNNDDSYVIGPCFDLSNIPNPAIVMSIWWESENNFDGAVLQSSLDAGLSWQRVGDFGDPNNWYTDDLIFGDPGGQPQGWVGRNGDGSGGWVVARHALDSLGGQSAVQLRIAFGSDGSVQDDGFAFDDILIYEIPNEDLGVSSFAEPSGSDAFCAGDSIPITVSVENYGVAGQIGYPITVEITGPTSSTITVTPPNSIQPGNSDTVFVGSIPSAIAGDYTLTAYTVLNGDTIPFNDTSMTVVTVKPVVDTYPYVEDFESGNGGWTVTQGDNGSWALGTPAKTVIQGAASGSNAWVTGGLGTGLYNANEDSYVSGPCFDFSTLVNPAILMNIWWESEFSWDGAVLQSSINSGATWENVGAFGDPNNWYTDNTINADPGGQAEGWSGRNGAGPTGGSNGWVSARHALDNLGGQSAVQLRVAFAADGIIQDDGFAFDDIVIYEIPTEDLGVTAILDPANGYCTGDTIPVNILIENFGVATQTNIPITINIVGPSPLTFTVTSPDPLAPGDVDTVNVGSFPALVPGDYSFEAYTVLSGDTTYFNDSSNIADLITITQVAATPTVIGDTICAQDSAEFMLMAQSAANNHFWYDSIGGSILFQGDTFNTGFLSTTTTYYVQASNGLVATDFAPQDNTIGPGGNANFTAGLLFDVFSDMTLNTVKVYPNGAGNIVVNLYDNAGTVLEISTFPFGGTVVDTVITLNWDIAPGVDYRIDNVGTTTGGLFRNSTPPVPYAYPFTSPGIISITNPTNLSTNFYYFYYDWQITAGGCPSSFVPVSATFAPPVAVNLGADGTVCQGYELDASGPGISSYVWNGDPGINTPTITPDTTGLYYVDVFNPDGCTGTDSVILIVNPSPVVNLGPDSTECDTIFLDGGNPGASYIWELPDGSTSTDPIIPGTQTGDYILTVTALGCPNSDTIGVVINESPDVDFGPDLGVCEPVILDAGPIGTPVWSTGDMTQQITVPAPMGGSSETISVTVTSAEGCVTFEEIVISEGIPPVFDLGSEITDCDSTTISVAPISGATYDWSTGDDTPTIVATTAGIITLTITDAGGCEATDSVDVDVQPTPVADATFSNPNYNNTVDFINNSTPSTGANYLWDFGDGLGTSTDASPVYTFPYDGTWEVTLIVSNDCGADTTSFIIGNVSIDKEFANLISVYPSPTKGDVFITSDDLTAENLTIEVLDSRGRSVVKDTKGQVFGSFKHVVNLKQEAEGIYMIKISDGERTAYKRVMKE